MALITERVALARNGANDKVICRLASGWAVMGDVQFLPGYCLLLPDPVVPSGRRPHATWLVPRTICIKPNPGCAKVLRVFNQPGP